MSSFKLFVAIPTLTLGYALTHGALADDATAAETEHTDNTQYKVWKATPVESMDVDVDDNHQYQVKWGDTLYNLAMKTNTNLNEIIQANQMDNPNEIYEGETIEIPIDDLNHGQHYNVQVQPDDDQNTNNNDTSSDNRSENKSNTDNKTPDYTASSNNDKASDDKSIETNADNTSSKKSNDSDEKVSKLSIDGKYVNISHMADVKKSDGKLKIDFKHPELFKGLNITVLSEDTIAMPKDDTETLNERIDEYNDGNYQAPEDAKTKVNENDVPKVQSAPKPDDDKTYDASKLTKKEKKALKDK